MKGPAGLGEQDASSEAIEELRPQVLFEKADVLAHSRLGEGEGSGGPSEGAGLSHRVEYQQAACTAGIYHSLPARDCRYIVQHSDSVLIFAEDGAQLSKLLQVRADLPDVRRVILLEGEGSADGWALSFEHFLEAGRSVAEPALKRAVSGARPDDVACLVYTSGTTGVPKGAMLTHRNLTFAGQSVRACVDNRDGDETLLFLPLAHVFARLSVYCSAVAGVPMTFARDIATVVEDMKVVRPHTLSSVPLVFEKIHAKVLADVATKPWPVRRLFDWAREIAARVADRSVARRRVPAWLGLQHILARALVFDKLREALGGRLRWAVCGGAPLDPALGRFFHGAGIRVLEGLGMTENTCLSHVNRFDRYRFGWVGLAAPGVEHKVAEDGELLVRGPNVMKGYYKDPDSTAQALTPDGWLRTGDLVELDPEGFLRITGRKKELIVTSGGKKVAPSAVESLLTASRYIAQACLVGDHRSYCTALLTLEPDAVREYSREHGVPEVDRAALQRDPRILDLVRREVNAVNRQLASFQTVKRFTVVDEFTVEEGALTPTLKVRRPVALERYAREIDAMYGERQRPPTMTA